MKNLSKIFLIPLAFMAMSCSNSSNESSKNMTLSDIEATPAVEAAPAMEESDLSGDINISSNNGYSTSFAKTRNETPVEENKIERKIIKNGEMELKVEDLKKAKTLIDAICKKVGGYYSNENLTKESYANVLSLTLRIPSEKFEMVLSEVEKGEFEIISKNISAEDVTSQFYDLTTRLESKRLSLKRFREILNKAQKVSDILEIEEKIGNIQEEIESAEGQLKLMKDQIGYGTLQLRLSKEFAFEPSHQDSFGERAKNAFASSWYSFVNFVLGIVGIWVFLLFLGIALLVVIRIWRKRRAKRME